MPSGDNPQILRAATSKKSKKKKKNRWPAPVIVKSFYRARSSRRRRRQRRRRVPKSIPRSTRIFFLSYTRHIKRIYILLNTRARVYTVQQKSVDRFRFWRNKKNLKNFGTYTKQWYTITTSRVQIVNSPLFIMHLLNWFFNRSSSAHVLVKNSAFSRNTSNSSSTSSIGTILPQRKVTEVNV